jgi:hypothetical protein
VSLCQIECTASLGHKLRPPTVNSGRSALSSWTLVYVGERPKAYFQAAHASSILVTRSTVSMFASGHRSWPVDNRTSSLNASMCPKVMTGPVRLERGWAEGPVLLSDQVVKAAFRRGGVRQGREAGSEAPLQAPSLGCRPPSQSRPRTEQRAATLRCRAASGDAEMPCNITESRIVHAAVCRSTPLLSPGSISSRARSVKTTEASPRGPNQPMNARVVGRRCVPISAIATGSILMTVRLSIA